MEQPSKSIEGCSFISHYEEHHLTNIITKTRPTEISDSGNTLEYKYDEMGRIESINNGEITYEYDAYGQLVTETNNVLDKTIEYEYNGNGIKKERVSAPFRLLINFRNMLSHLIC